LWIALAACASTLWLAVSNYLSQDVAAIPFLWVLPLTLYLLSFVLCFEWDGWYRPEIFRWLLPAAWIAIGSRIGLAGRSGDLRVDIAVMLAALFILCMFCHGELARTKPVRRQELAFFYLMIATGGAVGGIFVGLVAPSVFSTFVELPIGVVASVFLSLVLIYGVTSKGRLIRLAALAIAAFVAASSFHGGTTNVATERNFYGTLQIRDSGEGDLATRTLYNGRTAHGVEFLSAGRRDLPTAYYGKRSGIGLLLAASDFSNRRVAIVGLGAGTLAAYGRKGDVFRFYEINPAVIQAASTHFHFLADGAAATDVVTGDGRLRLEQEPLHSLDLIVLDAFSDDAIPVHLLTREAFQVYFARLRAGHSLAIHVTNRYLDLNPVVESLARAFQKNVLRIHSPADPEEQTLAADWAVVSGSDETTVKLRPFADSGPRKYGPLWTDEYSNLFQVWR
jgi:spermidine synthase